MLIEIKVSNFATIDNVHIGFGPGLNILSGETGAGKSILLKSLSLLMGAKSSQDMLRADQDTATVEGSFDISNREDIQKKIEDMGLTADDGILIVRRLISGQGKNRIYINGSLSPLSSLQDLVAPLIEVAGHATPLIEMTGQHENKNLLSKSYHLNLLDRFSNAFILRQEYQKLFDDLRSLRTSIGEIEASERNRAQRLDFLTYQRDEIKNFNLRAGEEEELEKEYTRLKNSHHLHQWAQQTENALYSDDESALVRIHKMIQRASDLSQFDSSLIEKIEPLKQAKTLIEDFVYEVRGYSEGLDSDANLEAIEKRRNDLKQLQKKYGTSSGEILSAFEEIEQEIKALEGSSENLQKLRKEEILILKQLEELSSKLSEIRKKHIKKLTKAVNDELEDLNMKGVIFDIEYIQLDELTSTGRDDIEFMIKSGAKEKPRPISKSASGGELSRILLSLKNIIGQSDVPRTYLFDEVDTGVSGPTAEKVGRKLHSISKGQQVICVTHLPQVAAHGDIHFLIQKSGTQKGFNTVVMSLKKDERIKEIARLISGEKITQTSLAHAKQLLQMTH